MKKYSVVYVECDRPVKVRTLNAEDAEEAGRIVMAVPYRKIMNITELQDTAEKPARTSSEIFSLLNELSTEYYEHAYTEQISYIEAIRMFYSRLIAIGKFTADDIRRIVE